MTTTSSTPTPRTSTPAGRSSTQPAAAQADRLGALAGEQLARDRWSRDRLLAYQEERLAALIAHAAAASPYYRELLGPDAASGEVPLRELPTLPKVTLMEHFDRIVTDPRLRRAELEAHLAGADAARPYLGRYRLFSTAGTTGLRGLFVYDADELAVWIGTCLRGLASWGLGPATRLAGIGSPSPLHISNAAYAVLLTNLVNHVQPLLRYELTDSVTLAGGPNPLGLPYARLASVDGRSDDVITLPAAGGGQVAVHPFRLRAPFSALLEVRQYQVVHDPAGLHVAVVLREEAPADTPARVRAALVRELRDAGAVPPPVGVTPVPGIERDPGHGAKLKLVRSAVSGR